MIKDYKDLPNREKPRCAQELQFDLRMFGEIVAILVFLGATMAIGVMMGC